jgi:hypothetical protein
MRIFRDFRSGHGPIASIISSSIEEALPSTVSCFSGVEAAKVMVKMNLSC